MAYFSSLHFIVKYMFCLVLCIQFNTPIRRSDIYRYLTENSRMATKIDRKGNYLPFYGYSMISMCEQNPKLIELYYILKSSPIAKYFEPLNYSTYHMTIFNIWYEAEKFYPYQMLGGKPKRELGAMNTIMKPVLFRMVEKMKEYPDLNTITLKNVKLYIRPRGSSLVLTVDVASEQQNEQIQNLRLWCEKQCNKSDANLRFHITLGYVFKEVNEDIEPACRQLDEWIKNNIPRIIIGKPTPMVFTSMETFIPYHQAFKKRHTMEVV